MRKLNSFLVALLLSFSVLIPTIPSQAVTGGVSSLNEFVQAGAPEKVEVAKDIYKVLLSMDFSKESAAAIVGSIANEGGLSPTAVEMGNENIRTQIDSAPCNVPETYDRVNGSGMGLIGFDGIMKSRLACWAHENGEDVWSVDGQMHFIFNEWIPNVEDPFKATAYFTQAYNKYCISGAGGYGSMPAKGNLKYDCESAPKEGFPNGFEDFKKLTNAGEASYLWTTIFEKPDYALTGNHMDARELFAEDVLKEFEGITTDSSSSDSSSSDSSSSSSENISVSSANYKLPTEDELLGMPVNPTFPAGAPIEKKSLSDLSSSQQWHVQNAKGSLLEQKTPLASKVSVIFTFLGLVLFCYFVILALAGGMERYANPFNLPLVSLLTFGKLNLGIDKTETTVTLPDVLSRATLGICSSLLLLSGTLFFWFSRFYVWLADLLA